MSTGTCYIDTPTIKPGFFCCLFTFLAEFRKTGQTLKDSSVPVFLGVDPGSGSGMTVQEHYGMTRDYSVVLLSRKNFHRAFPETFVEEHYYYVYRDVEDEVEEFGVDLPLFIWKHVFYHLFHFLFLCRAVAGGFLF